MAVYAAAVLLEEDKETVLRALSDVQPPKGRFEQYMSAHSILAIVDYAHTPDALENVLHTIQDIRTNQKIITVVGCGGDRDKTKRPIMAKIAEEKSDILILTSDNPRTESAEAILEDMLQGIENTQTTLVISDRKSAIEQAVALAHKGDILLIAGKGHETYQEINHERTHFDDKEVVMVALENKQIEG